MRPILTAAVAASSLALAGSTFAATVLNTSFEAPGFTTGNLDGQNNFAVVDVTAGSTAAFNVVANNARTGTQAVSATSSLGTPSATGAPVASATFGFPTDTALANLTPTAAEPIVTLNLSVLRPTPAAGATNVSTAVGLDVFSAADRITGLFLFNNTTVAGTPGTLVPAFLGRNATTGAVGFFIANGTVSYGSYQDLRVVLDYRTDTYNLFVNGTPTTDATGAVANIPFITGADDFSDADLTIQGGRGDLSYFDDYSIVTSAAAVPEPATAGLLGVASLGLLARRRRA